MAKIAVLSATCLCLFGFSCQFAVAQHLVKMSDQRWIELALDMIRKGVQEEDTAKVFVVFAPQVVVNGKEIEEKGDLTTRLQTVFDNSGQRQMALARPTYPRADNPLRASNFWDFDILDPQITIKGDSAFVDCELVLWGAPKDVKSQENGRRVSERFVFYSPPKVQQAAISDSSFRFPPPPPGKNATGGPRGWQLVGYESLVEFLEDQVAANTETKEKTTGEKR
jgi:hypothetical protein